MYGWFAQAVGFSGLLELMTLSGGFRKFSSVEEKGIARAASRIKGVDQRNSLDVEDVDDIVGFRC